MDQPKVFDKLESCQYALIPQLGSPRLVPNKPFKLKPFLLYLGRPEFFKTQIHQKVNSDERFMRSSISADLLSRFSTPKLAVFHMVVGFVAKKFTKISVLSPFPTLFVIMN